MGLFFNVYPPADLAKLDDQKRKELAAVIRQVLQSDPDVQKLIQAKTQAKYDDLIRRT